jgi:hypothetical protein
MVGAKVKKRQGLQQGGLAGVVGANQTVKVTQVHLNGLEPFEILDDDSVNPHVRYFESKALLPPAISFASHLSIKWGEGITEKEGILGAATVSIPIRNRD